MCLIFVYLEAERYSEEDRHVIMVASFWIPYPRWKKSPSGRKRSPFTVRFFSTDVSLINVY